MRRSIRILAVLLLASMAAGCDDGSSPSIPAAPSPVADLAVLSVTDSTATLTWTAPRVGSATGRAARYEILYKLGAAPVAGWDTASVVASPPVPAWPGTPERFTVPGLTRLTTYLFVVRSDDGQNGWSGVSNAAKAAISWTPVSSSDFIAKFEAVYRQRSWEHFQSLFPAPGDSLQYLFFAYDGYGPPPDWDQAEELRIHRRMFRPEEPLPEETPVPDELWLWSIDIQVVPQEEWTERVDLYRSVSNPNGLDPAHWRVMDAIYQAYVLFTTMGETNYLVNGRQNFVVVENLTLPPGRNGKFLFYRWEDLGPFLPVAMGTEPTNWSAVKSLYAR